jgi:HPt (histidine-containing phosphotransfer) domain-containing protein
MKHEVTVKNKLKKYIPQFMDNAQKDIHLLTQAALDKNIPVMERISHSIKGYGKPFGFDTLGDLSAQINAAIKAGNIDDAISMIHDLDDYFSKIVIVYGND